MNLSVSRTPLKSLALALSAILATGAGAAQAHESGNTIVRIGAAATHINKDPINALTGALPAQDWDVSGFGFTLKNDTAPVLDVTWMFSDAFGLNVGAGAFTHDLRISAADPLDREYDGVNLFELKQRVATIGGVWYPLGNTASKFHPYVGAGVNYTRAKTSIHNDFANVELGFIDADLKAGLITEAEAAEERQFAHDVFAAARSRDSKWGGNVQIGADYMLTNDWLLNGQVRYTRAASNLGYWNYTVGVGFKF